MKLKEELVKVENLSQAERKEMFELLGTYFGGVSWDSFFKDLSEKEWVILLRDQELNIKGFSTIMVIGQAIDKVKVKAVFSGDTIIDEKCWGDWALFRAFARFIISLMNEFPDSQVYWFLISMGYRTYLLLPLFFNEFYPRYNKPMPDFEKKILDSLASKKFPDEYDSSRGVISFKRGGEFLKPGVSDISPAKLKNLHVKFFLKKNPFYSKGDELACLALISKENLKPMVYRLAGLKRQDD